MSGHDEERRRYPRIRASILMRPTGPMAEWRAKPPVSDISVGGLRTYADDKLAVGTRLSIDLVFPDGESIHALAKVVWVKDLAEGSPARFDVGLSFLEIRPEDQERLAALAEAD